MKQLTQKDRLMFLYNQGVRMAGNGYDRDVNVAFDKLKSYKPFTRLNIGDEGEFPFDFVSFKLGFVKMQNLRIRAMKMKAQAETELRAMLAKLSEGEVSTATHYTELEGYTEAGEVC